MMLCTMTLMAIQQYPEAVILSIFWLNLNVLINFVLKIANSCLKLKDFTELFFVLHAAVHTTINNKIWIAVMISAEESMYIWMKSNLLYAS